MWPKIKRLLVLGLELGFLYKRVRGQWKVGFLTGLGGELRVTLLSAKIGHLASRTLQLKFCDLLIKGKLYLILRISGAKKIQS